MRRILAVVLVLAAFSKVAFSADAGGSAKVAKVDLVVARADIGKVIENPVEMTAVVKKLSSEDQVKFLAEVNAAIAKMPGSAEEKAAKYLNVNHAALKGAEKGNLTKLVAEVFATVPPEHLTIIADRFGEDVFNRAADPSVTYTDAQFADIAVETMEKINERTDEVDNSAVRSTIAALMFIKASNGTSEELITRLVDTMPPDVREIAKNEWIASALGTDGRTKSFEPLLAAADAGRSPNPEMTLIVAGPQNFDVLLADLTGGNTDPAAAASARNPVVDAVINPINYAIPTLGGDATKGKSASVPPQTGGDIPIPVPVPEPKPEPEPGPYGWQSTNN